MRVPGGTAIDVRALLARVEAGPPVEAAESVAATLAEVLDARSATFLVSDFSGHAVVRLTSVGAVTGATGARTAEQEENVLLEGTRYDRVLLSRRVDVPDLIGGAGGRRPS